MIGDAPTAARSRSPGSAATFPSACSRTTSSRRMVDTSDEWIVERTGSASGGSPRPTRRSRTSRFRPREQALARRRSRRRPTIDLIDRRDGDAGHDLPVDAPRSSPTRSARRRGRLRPLAGCTGFIYGLAQALRDGRGGPRAEGARRRRRRPLEDPGLDRPLDAASSSATARARSCSSAVDEGGFLGFELGADGGGRRRTSACPAAARARRRRRRPAASTSCR